MTGDPHETFHFGPFTLDVTRGCLRLAEREIALRPKSYEVLHYLVKNGDRLISKEELMEAVWRNLVVTDDSLTRCISDVRQALGDEGQRIIKTVPRRGYILALPIEQGPATPAKLEMVSRSHIEVVPPLVLPDLPSIAVLPFANLSGDPSQDYFADGMVEDITIALGRLPGLFVIGSGSGLTYKNRAVGARQIGSELGVRYLLRGSVRKQGSQVRITAELIDASHGGQVWADRLEGELDSIFAMQDQVACHVSMMIAPALRTAEIARTERKRTDNLTAYDLFLRASRRYRESFEQNQRSLHLLYQAIELDPSYAAAYGLAAFCYQWQKSMGWAAPSDSRLQEGVRLAQRAAETGQDDSEAVWMAAQALGFIGGELDLALALNDRSLSLNPNSPGAWQSSAVIHCFNGKTDLALEHANRARRHNPLDPLAIWYLSIIGFMHFYAGLYEKAADAIGEVLKRQPNFPPALRMQIATYGLLGRIEEGRECVKRLITVDPWASMTNLQIFFEVPLRRNPRALANLLKGLRLSGVPET